MLVGREVKLDTFKTKLKRWPVLTDSNCYNCYKKLCCPQTSPCCPPSDSVNIKKWTKEQFKQYKWVISFHCCTYIITSPWIDNTLLFRWLIHFHCSLLFRWLNHFHCSRCLQVPQYMLLSGVIIIINVEEKEDKMYLFITNQLLCIFLAGWAMVLIIMSAAIHAVSLSVSLKKHTFPKLLRYHNCCDGNN